MLRVAVAAAPLTAGVAAGITLGRLVPQSRVTVLGWWLLVLGGSALVVAGVERLGRRLLPLATLLQLSLLFPDRAPSRFAVALRAGSSRRLADRLLDVERATDGTPAAAAEAILALIGALTLHDRPSRGHSERVRAFTDLIAGQMGLHAAERDRLRWAALLHDVGKLSVAPAVLNKPARLDDDEWEVVRRHPAEGERLVAPLSTFLGEWADTVGQHHERWDGSGYPHGLAGEQISRGARIVAVADAFEVMTGTRTYRRPLRPELARAELVANNATQFDPHVVRAFLNVSLGTLRRVLTPLAWLLQVPFLAGAGPDTGLAGGDAPAAPGDGLAQLHPLSNLHALAHPHPVLGFHPAWQADAGDDGGDAVADVMRAGADPERQT